MLCGLTFRSTVPYSSEPLGRHSRPPHGEMNNPLEARNYSIIEGEGDGYRSYVGTCLSLLVGIRPVALIDEPELCLHPPQAYHIGRFIGELRQGRACYIRRYA